jgi:hypothetical protein
MQMWNLLYLTRCSANNQKDYTYIQLQLLIGESKAEEGSEWIRSSQFSHVNTRSTPSPVLGIEFLDLKARWLTPAILLLGRQRSGRPQLEASQAKSS